MLLQIAMLIIGLAIAGIAGLAMVSLMIMFVKALTTQPA